MMMMMVMVTMMVNICDDDCYLVMKVILLKKVMSSDVSPVAMFSLRVPILISSIYFVWLKSFYCYELYKCSRCLLEFFMLTFLFRDKLSRFLREEMYSGIHVFSLANILKTGRGSVNGVKDSIYKNFRIEGKVFFSATPKLHFVITTSTLGCESIISICTSSMALLSHTHTHLSNHVYFGLVRHTLSALVGLNSRLGWVGVWDDIGTLHQKHDL